MITADKVKNIFPSVDQIPERFRIENPVEQTEYLIGGKLKKWDGPLAEIHSAVCVGEEPSGRIIGRVPRCTPEIAMKALEAAASAYDNGRGAWPTMTVRDRIGCVEKFAAAMKDKREEVVKLLMWEIAKPLKDAQKEFDRTVEYVLDTVEALKELDRRSSRFDIVENIIAQIRRAPLGVSLCMGPYNYPLNETFTILIPALIMGNTVVLKPPKHGVLLYRPMLEALAESFPPGVVNTVYGDGSTVIGPLMQSGKIDVLGFIGSCKVADLLKSQHPKPHRLRSVLGLGAKNAAIILPDADIDLAVKECLLGGLSFNGQRCTAIKLIFVHKKIADDFVTRLAKAVDGLNPGMPWDDGVEITPLPVPDKPAFLTELCVEAKKNGASVMNPGGALVNRTFFSPAVVYPVNDKMRLYHLEQFGPVVPVLPFTDIAEPVQWVENSPYGQQAALFGSDPDELAKLIDPLVNQVCRLNLNCQCQRGPDAFPFTGRKDSAEGTLSVSDALRVFSIRTLVAAKQNPLNQKILDAVVRGRKSNFLSTDFIF